MIISTSTVIPMISAYGYDYCSWRISFSSVWFRLTCFASNRMFLLCFFLQYYGYFDYLLFNSSNRRLRLFLSFWIATSTYHPSVRLIIFDIKPLRAPAYCTGRCKLASLIIFDIKSPYVHALIVREDVSWHHDLSHTAFSGRRSEYSTV